MKCYSVYCITNIINKKKYIGITSQTLKERFHDHIQEAKKNSNRYLCRAIRKYGVENFTIELIDDSATSPAELYVLEQNYIEKYNTYFGEGYNMTLGGEGTLGKPCNDITKKKISNATKGKQKWGINGNIHPALGTTQSKESNKKRSEKLKGKTVSKETIEKRLVSWYKTDRKGKNSPLYGKHHSEISKQKMRENNWYKTEKGKLWAKEQGINRIGENNPMYGKKWDEEHLKIFKEKSSGGNNPNAIPTIILDSNNNIISIHSCRKEIIGFKEITQSQLTNRIKTGKDYKGYYFKSITKEEYEIYLKNLR